MNPQGALGGALNNVERLGAGLTEHTVMPAVNLGSAILGNLARDFRPPPTRQLPPGVQSPIPQNQVVPHQRGPVGSWNNSWLGIGVNALGQQLGNLFNRPANSIQPTRVPTPTQQPIRPSFQSNPNQLPAGLSPLNIPHPTAQPTMASPTVTPTPPLPTPQGAVTQVPGLPAQVSQNFTTMLNQHILPVTRQYGIPDALVAGQAAQESGYMQKPAGQYNFFGLKAHSYPGFANFQTPEEAARYYAQTIQALVPNIGQMNAQQGLMALQSGRQRYEGDNPNPMMYVQSVSANPAFQVYNSSR